MGKTKEGASDADVILKRNQERQAVETISNSETSVNEDEKNQNDQQKRGSKSSPKKNIKNPSNADTPSTLKQSKLPTTNHTSPLKMTPSTPPNQTRRRYPRRSSTQKTLLGYRTTPNNETSKSTTKRSRGTTKSKSPIKESATPTNKFKSSNNSGSIRNFFKVKTEEQRKTVASPNSEKDASTSKSPTPNNVPKTNATTTATPTPKPKTKPRSRSRSKSKTKTKTSKKNTSYLPFPKLSAGDRFITSYGVVQVLHDKFAPSSSSSTDTDTDQTRTRVTPLTKSEAHAQTREREKVTNIYKRAYVHNADKLRKSRRKLRKYMLSLYPPPTSTVPDKESKEPTLPRNFNRVFYLENQRDQIAIVPLDDKGKFVRRTASNVVLTNHTPMMEKRKDPLIPSDSLPDRIVECILIPDQRTRTILTTDDMILSPQIPSNVPNITLCLRRRLLTVEYIPTADYYHCIRCGKHLTTRGGAKSHMQRNSCLNKTRQLPLWVPSPRRKRTYPKKDPEIDRIRNEKKRIKLAAEREIRYASLGIQPIFPKSEEEFKRRQMTNRNSSFRRSSGGTYNRNPININATAAVYLEVWTALEFREKKKRKRPPWVKFDSQFSSMYPSTYRALQFQANRVRKSLIKTTIPTSSKLDPNTPLKKKRRTPAQVKYDKEQHRLEKEREKKEKAASSTIVVDMMVLVEEVDTGRYPSIKRYDGEHCDECVICKQNKGILYCCEFCSNACHLECLRERVIIRDPEPEDDFMCNSCIAKVLSRRSRAEKRRLLKRDDALVKSGIHPTTTITTTNTTPTIATKNISSLTTSNMVQTSHNTTTHTPLLLETITDSEVASLRTELGVTPCPVNGPGGLICCDVCAKSYSQVLADVSNEMEMQVVSMIGREVSEMVELLTDAQWRAKQAVELSFENDARRMLLDEGDY